MSSNVVLSSSPEVSNLYLILWVIAYTLIIVLVASIQTIDNLKDTGPVIGVSVSAFGLCVLVSVFSYYIRKYITFSTFLFLLFSMVILIAIPCIEFAYIAKPIDDPSKETIGNINLYVTLFGLPIASLLFGMTASSIFSTKDKKIN